MNQLTKLIEQYERETNKEAKVYLDDGTIWIDEFVLPTKSSARGVRWGENT